MLARRRFCQIGIGAVMAPLLPMWGAARSPSRADFSFLDERLRERVGEGYFSGISLQIGMGERLLHEAYFGDGAPDRVLHVASTGKWVAAATVAAVVDEGHLSWDSRARDFVPALKDSKGDADLSELLSHTAGYPDYQPPSQPRDDYQSLREAVAHIVDLPAIAAPGTLFKYGGLSMQVAGRMAELAAGTGFEQIFERRIAGPLGMAKSGFVPVSLEDGFSPMLAGGFFTCVTDYARFLMMIAQDGLYRDRRILSRNAVREMQADHVKGAKVGPHEFVEEARADLRRDIYGLGEWREETDASGRPTLVSSPGWAGAYAWVDKTAGIWGAVIAKANVEHAVREGYSTFYGSSIYAPMVRDALAETRDHKTKRGRVPVRGGRLFYEERGRGPALIFLHGYGLDRREWRAQLAALSERFRIVVYDLRGYGRSSNPAEGAPYNHADDLLALMDRLGIRKAHLVGRSLGGQVMDDFLTRHPERVLSASLVETPDIAGWLPDPGSRGRNERIALVKKEGVHVCKRRLLDALVGRLGANRDALRQPLWQMIDQWRAWQLLHGEDMSAPPVEDTSANIPTLRIAGEMAHDDPVVVPRGAVEIVPQAGIIPNLEEPDKFNALLVSFVTRILL